MATPTATLSSIWRALPSDITEQILTRLVDAHFHTDPAYTWSALRHLSAHQKRVLERRFATFWLPKLSITLYGRVTHQVEYRFLATSPDDAADAEHEDDAKATFAVPEDALRAIERRGGGWVDGGLRGMWADYDLTANRNVTVRLGEGLLNGGCWGGYMVNNTALPGLEVLEGGKIRFEWKRAVDELLREEMWMRRVGGEMVSAVLRFVFVWGGVRMLTAAWPIVCRCRQSLDSALPRAGAPAIRRSSRACSDDTSLALAKVRATRSTSCRSYAPHQEGSAQQNSTYGTQICSPLSEAAQADAGPGRSRHCGELDVLPRLLSSAPARHFRGCRCGGIGRAPVGGISALAPTTGRRKWFSHRKGSGQRGHHC